MWKRREVTDQGMASHTQTGPRVERSTAPARLVIQGRVEGSVSLEQYAVTVGPEGQVKAHITARIVMVEGRVEGHLVGEEQVVLRKSSSVEGDIRAPRVVLEDSAYFRGGVQMGEALEEAKRQARAPTKEAAPPDVGRRSPASLADVPAGPGPGPGPGAGPGKGAMTSITDAKV